MNTLSATIRASKRSTEVTVGPWDDERHDHRFGWDAVLRISDDMWYGERSLRVEVSFGAIGSLSADEALQRSSSYSTASEIGAALLAVVNTKAYEGVNGGPVTYDNLVDIVSTREWMEGFGAVIESIVDYREEDTEPKRRKQKEDAS